MNNDFLPQGYIIPDTTSGYMKLEKGANKIRVLSSAITGWETWHTKPDGTRSPYRSRQPMMASDVQLNPQTGEPETVKHFWAFVVWNYKAQKPQILEITQKSVQKALKAFIENEDWGSPKNYDLTITREGDGFDTEYGVVASPPKPTDPAILAAYKGVEINLEALYDGADPFSPQKPNEKNEKTVPELDIDEIDAAISRPSKEQKLQAFIDQKGK